MAMEISKANVYKRRVYQRRGGRGGGGGGGGGEWPFLCVLYVRNIVEIQSIKYFFSLAPPGV